MRVVVTATRIPERIELDPGPLDAEWLLQLGNDHALTVLVDHETPGSQRLREARIDIHVSAKRESILPDGSELSADGAQARYVATLHAEEPLDLIIYDSRLTVDYAWDEPTLGPVTKGIALGGGLVGNLRAVLADAAMFRDAGREAWSGTGLLAAADFLLSNVGPAEFGYREQSLPPVRATVELGEFATSGPDQPPGLLVVVATSEDPVGLASVVKRATDRVPVDETTTIAVIHSDLQLGPDAARDLIIDGCPNHLLQSVILMTPDQDGTAAAFLDKADFIVAARPADLAIKAVAGHDHDRVLLLEGRVPSIPLLDDVPAPRTTEPTVVLLPIEGHLNDALEALTRLEADGEADAVVIYDLRHADEAHRFLGLRALHGCDLAVVAHPDRTYGGAIPSLPCRAVIAATRSAWPSLRRRMQAANSLEALVESCLGLDLAERVRLLVLPGSSHGSAALGPEIAMDVPAWLGSNGVLPRPNLAGVGTVAPLEDVASTGDAVREWIQDHSWRERATLALPWRWGLLERAMRDIE